MPTTDLSDAERARLVEAAEILNQAQRPLAVLRSTAWPDDVAADFFAGGASRLPRVQYEPVDTSKTSEQVAAARALIDGTSPVHRWLGRLADVIADTAQLLAARGTKDFFDISCRLFGSPQTLFSDGMSKTSDLARRLEDILGQFHETSLVASAGPVRTASELKAFFDAELAIYMGDDAPEVRLVDSLASRASAGRNYIKLRSDVMFSELDADQLLHHEAYIHILTGVNGRAQSHFPILGEAHPGNTRTQEGLAVFAEFITGSLGPHRLIKLADRVTGIQMSADGASFLDLYRHYLDKDFAEMDAFDAARRVVRGGLVEGGAPFTKDSVYLGGLLDVHSYLRTAVRLGDPSLMTLMFIGKFDLGDIEAMLQLRRNGLIDTPRHLPPWARDMRHLVSYLAYSVFLNQVRLDKVNQRYDFLCEGDSCPIR